MSAHGYTESERARASFAARAQRMLADERREELLVGAGFIVVALALALIGGVEKSFSLPIAALYVLGIAAAGHVRFDIGRGRGFTVPTQAVFVPMLFAVPVSLVPLLVALALALGMVPLILSGHESPSRLLDGARQQLVRVGAGSRVAACARSLSERALGHLAACAGRAVRL